MEEDAIILKTEDLPNPVDDIGTWIESHSITLWGKAFKEFFSKDGTYTKKELFLVQAGTENAMKRAILRYFWRELVIKGAIDRKNIPQRFNKWVDVSSSECIFSDYQKKYFGRPHLLQCPWYLELKENERCPGEERALKASCDNMMQQLEAENLVHIEEDASEVGDDNSISDKQRKKLADKKAKVETRLKEKEEKKKGKEEEIKLKKEVAARNKELAKLVLKEGPEKLLSYVGISPSGSSMPATITPLVSQVPLSVAPFPSQTVYTIPCSQLDDVESGIEIINDSPSGILDLFDDVTESDEPKIWRRMKAWIKDHQGNKIRSYAGCEADNVVDLVIFDVPEDLPVPGLGIAGEIPPWNRHPKTKPEGIDGKVESIWIKRHFEFAMQFLQDDGALIVFYPDSKFISNELLSWADWANFQEESKWFAINGLPLTVPDHPSRTHKCFMVKCFVRKENPDEEVPMSNFVFCDRPELLAQGIKLSSDGHLTNLIDVDSLTVQSENRMPFRGAREKSSNLLMALIDLCTVEDDIVMDLTASTCIIFSLYFSFDMFCH